MNGQQTQPESHHYQGRFQINANTGVSLGIIVLILAGFWTVMSVLGTMRESIGTIVNATAMTKMELSSRIDKNEARLLVLEASKNNVTSTEFFRWAVHLQQSNPSIKVPEPQTDAK